MSILNDRIKERRLATGKTLLEVAELLGVREATAQRYESGKIKSIKHSTIVALAEIFNCSPAYLMGWTDSTTSSSYDYPELEPMPGFVRTPLLGDIACGEPSLALENADEFVSMPEHIVADFALRCKGDSMINARIFDGDIVYIRSQSTVDDGEIAAVLIDDEATLKRVHLFGDHIVLEPENPMYKPLVYWGEDMNSVRILGKAVAFTSTVR